MGRDKALLEVARTPLAIHVARALEAAGAARVVAIGGDRDGLAALGLTVVADDTPGAGPLGGILTALRWSPDDVVAVLACDLPHAAPGAVEAVVAALRRAPSAAVAWPAGEGPAHVLHAAWRSSVARPVLAAAFAGGERSVRRAASSLSPLLVAGVPAAALRDADAPEDLPRR